MVSEQNKLDPQIFRNICMVSQYLSAMVKLFGCPAHFIRRKFRCGYVVVDVVNLNKGFQMSIQHVNLLCRSTM